MIDEIGTVVDGYTFDGITLSVLLPTEAATINDARITIMAYDDGNADFVVVPEPSSSMLGLIGAIALLRRRR